MQVVYHVKSRFHQHYHLQGFLNRVRCVMDRDCKKFLEFLVTMTLILKLSDDIARKTGTFYKSM